MGTMSDKEIEILPTSVQLKIYKWKAKHFEAQAKKFESEAARCKNFVDQLTSTFIHKKK